MRACMSAVSLRRGMLRKPSRDATCFFSLFLLHHHSRDTEPLV